jgi:UDP-glucose 4-epimerase
LNGVGYVTESNKEVTVISMKVIITGASGFLGSWICRVLAAEFEVIALVRETSDLVKLADLRNIEIIQLKNSLWGEFIIASRPDVLILNHWSGVSNEDRNSTRQFENVQTIQKLTDAAISAGTQTIIGVGSQAELGPVSSTISEIDVDNPTTLYGQAKVNTRIIIDDSTRDAETRFIWMRIFSTYGPLDGGTWLIPNIVDSLMKNKVIGLTKGEQMWSYLHAYDLASAFQTVIREKHINGIVNVGNPQTISIREAASSIGKVLDKEDLLEFGALDYRPDQVMRLQPLCETLTKSGWSPQISFEQGIRQTIDWLQRKDLRPIFTESGKALDFKIPARP